MRRVAQGQPFGWLKVAPSCLLVPLGQVEKHPILIEIAALHANRPGFDAVGTKAQAGVQFSGLRLRDRNRQLNLLDSRQGARPLDDGLYERAAYLLPAIRGGDKDPPNDPRMM